MTQVTLQYRSNDMEPTEPPVLEGYKIIHIQQYAFVHTSDRDMVNQLKQHKCSNTVYLPSLLSLIRTGVVTGNELLEDFLNRNVLNELRRASSAKFIFFPNQSCYLSPTRYRDSVGLLARLATTNLNEVLVHLDPQSKERCEHPSGIPFLGLLSGIRAHRNGSNTIRVEYEAYGENRNEDLVVWGMHDLNSQGINFTIPWPYESGKIVRPIPELHKKKEELTFGLSPCTCFIRPLSETKAPHNWTKQSTLVDDYQSEVSEERETVNISDSLISKGP